MNGDFGFTCRSQAYLTLLFVTELCLFQTSRPTCELMHLFLDLQTHADVTEGENKGNVQACGLNFRDCFKPRWREKFPLCWVNGEKSIIPGTSMACGDICNGQRIPPNHCLIICCIIHSTHCYAPSEHKVQSGEDWQGWYEWRWYRSALNLHF